MPTTNQQRFGAIGRSRRRIHVSVESSIDRFAIRPLIYANSCGCAIVRMSSYPGLNATNHPTYGTGKVVALIEPQKMDVLFADRIRRLIHSKA